MSNIIYYNMKGSIFIEGTNEEANYDFDMEWPELEAAPNDMNALDYMMQVGIIQIMHKETQLIERL